MIEKKKAIDLYDKSPTTLGKQISQSPRRSSVEAAIEREFQRVRGRFINRQGKLHDCWYGKKLRDLAKAVGFEAEYELFQKNFSGVVHSSSYALREGMQAPGSLLMDMAWRFSFRILGKFAEYMNVALDRDEAEIIRRSQVNVFDDPLASIDPEKTPK